MNTQPLTMVTTIENSTAEMDMLVQHGFNTDEIVSLLWLRQWYQNGGSDRIQIIRHLEFLKLLVVNNKIEL
jgi:hypothetical protein